MQILCHNVVIVNYIQQSQPKGKDKEIYYYAQKYAQIKRTIQGGNGGTARRQKRREFGQRNDRRR